MQQPGRKFGGVRRGGVSIVTCQNRRTNGLFTLTMSSPGYMVGLTPQGRATTRLLDMNGSPQLALRRELIMTGEFQDA